MDKSYFWGQESIAMKAEFAKLPTQQERDVLVADFVSKLKQHGLTTDEIKSVLNIELVTGSQSSRVFISQTTAYKAAVAKALGEKK
jgi:hypothetical protein